MTEEEIESYNDLLKIYAGIALPGIIGKAIWVSKEEIAIQAFDLAEVMIVECKKREKCTQK